MTLRLKLAILALAGMLSGCASVDAAPQPGTITYEITSQGPFCFSGCEFIKFIALPSGEVRLERSSTDGKRDIRTERRVLHVRPDQLAAFRARLEPLRPTGTLRRNGSDSCRSFTDDLAELTVTWSGPHGGDQLLFGFGCDLEESASVRDALREAPSLIDIRSPL